jgi:hypothetical protein
MMSKTFLPLFVLAGFAAGIAGAQPVGAGIKLGVPFTDAYNAVTTEGFTLSAQRFVWGAYGEVRLPAQMAIEVDVLHQSLNLLNSSQWEFPVVVKHKMLPGPIKPYFEGGIAFSSLSGAQQLIVNHNENFGIVVGGGVEIHLLNLKLSPEIRYDGWLFRNFNTVSQPAPGAPAVQSNRNQVAFLVGFGF